MDNIEERHKEVRESFKELILWREELQRQFSKVIQSHSNCIDKAICEFVEEVYNLMKRHIEAVHENIRNFVCGECGYSASILFNTVHTCIVQVSMMGHLY